MNNSKLKTKKKSIIIKKESKKKSKNIENEKSKLLENTKNPIYQKYLIEFENFFKEKKKNDKSKKKSYTYDHTSEKLIKSNSSGKKIIHLPKYILTDQSINEIESRLKELEIDLNYINNLVDFSDNEQEISTEIKTKFQELKKEYVKLEKSKLNQIEIIKELNDIETIEVQAEKQMAINAKIRENRDIYFMIQEKFKLKEDITDLVKEYISNKKNIDLSEKKPTIKKEINYIIEKLPSIEK